jgi:hypothetical protein
MFLMLTSVLSIDKIDRCRVRAVAAPEIGGFTAWCQLKLPSASLGRDNGGMSSRPQLALWTTVARPKAPTTTMSQTAEASGHADGTALRPAA